MSSSCASPRNNPQKFPYSIINDKLVLLVADGSFTNISFPLLSNCSASLILYFSDEDDILISVFLRSCCSKYFKRIFFEGVIGVIFIFLIKIGESSEVSVERQNFHLSLFYQDLYLVWSIFYCLNSLLHV